MIARDEPSIFYEDTRRSLADPMLLGTLAVALLFHGSLLFSTVGRTYDAYVHIFFADHYARAWFDHWEYRWYTGFTVTSYPPGAQQTIALLSYAVGLKNGFVLTQLFALMMLTIGVYRSSQLWVDRECAGFAAVLAIFSSSIIETVHVFGQLPTTFALGFLLNALPFVRRWIHTGNTSDLARAWILSAATTSGHHVTTLFGSVFFVGPVIVLSLVEVFRTPLPDEPSERPLVVTRSNWRPLVIRRVRRILPALVRVGIYGAGVVGALVIVVLPYWLLSRSDPIVQVSIPHASRDSFIENPNAGLVFWLVPYGTTLPLVPYLIIRGLQKRTWPLALSLALLALLGTGGTTPIPRLLLRGAFDVLTLDRFTFWATIAQLPLLGALIVDVRKGRLATILYEQFGKYAVNAIQGIFVLTYLLIGIAVANLTYLRPFQPAPIEARPIAAFMEKDQHWRWRFLTLGFGDQMAWLSAQTTALSVDGNYHSARRLPELTSTPVERLEGAKFSGVPGIGSLQQFLGVPEKYNLKFVFSNDPFYDPLLYFSGWHRLQRLENGIEVWERDDVPPLPEVLPRKEIPAYQRVMWGVLPMTALVTALTALIITALSPRTPKVRSAGEGFLLASPLYFAWKALDRRLLQWSLLPASDESPPLPRMSADKLMRRLGSLRPVSPLRWRIRAALLVGIGVAGLGFIVLPYVLQKPTPEKVVEKYYDDLDFRRFPEAYARLDPQTRPSYEQYLLERSVSGGIVASYGKLDTVTVRVLAREPERVSVEVTTNWITALAAYPSIQRHAIVLRAGSWYILPDAVDVTIPPDQLVRQSGIDWYSAGRRRVTTETTTYEDVIDRPELEVRSARLVYHAERYTIVGELMNVDVDPADVTVTGVLYDAEDNELARYNAQEVTVHKVNPKEVTPFRIEFEGVAGANLAEPAQSTGFRPGAFTPPVISGTPVRFEVYARAVVTTRDLTRSLTVQDVMLEPDVDGTMILSGRLLNGGTREATIPHVLVTYYNQDGDVVWVDHLYISDAIRPQRARPFQMPLVAPETLTPLLLGGDQYANVLGDEEPERSISSEFMYLPDGSPYAALRITTHAFEGGTQ